MCGVTFNGTQIQTGLLEVSKYCTDLVELDVSGCWHVTNKSLYALQENLMHMRTEKNCDFCLTIGGRYNMQQVNNY